MNSKHRFVLTTLMVASLAACSGSEERRRQANQDFTYLETKPLSNWVLPEGTEPYATNEYAIPNQAFAGEIGAGVDIRSPQQVLALIPGARVVKNANGVTLVLANSEELAGVWSLTKTMLTEQGIALREQTASRLETEWVSWTNEDDETQVSSRYTIEKSEKPGDNSYQITLIDWREGEKDEPVSVINKERYSILMTNLVMSRYDAKVREEARLRAQELVKQIPITMGQDRSGLPVIIARAPYNVFWERLPSLLDELGFTVEGRNRSQGIVEVKFRSPDDQFWTDLGVKPIELDDSTYKLQLGDLGNRTSLSVTDSDGKPITERALESIAPVFGKAIESSNRKS